MRLFLTLACLAIALVASLGATELSIAQDSIEDRLHLQMKENDAKVDEYLQKHPVRQSLLIESAGDLLVSLAKFDMMILGACEYVSDSLEWQEMARGLRENTVLALAKRYLGAKKKYMAETPLAAEIKDDARCADYKLDRIELYSRLPGVFAALRKQHY